MREGDRVVFTQDQLGLVENLNQRGFKEEMVNAGDEGVYVEEHPLAHGADTRLPDWHIVKVKVGGRELLCPCHESHFKVAGDA